MSELKACPFCNREDSLYVGQYELSPRKLVGCDCCGVKIPEEYWNRRLIESSLESKLKVAVEALEGIEIESGGFAEGVRTMAQQALAKIRSRAKPRAPLSPRRISTARKSRT